MRFGLVCLFYILIHLALGELPRFDCNTGSLNVSLQEDGLGFLSIDCSSPLVAELSLDGIVDESCQAVQNLKIVPKQEWQVSEGRVPVEDISSPADYVVMNMLPHPYPVGGDIVRKLQNLQNEHNINHGNLLYNFIIVDDGTIYEGLGWDKKNYINSGGLNSLRIRFMTEKVTAAPAPAVQAYKFLVRAGKCRGSIASNYKLIPHSHIRDYVPSAIFNLEYEVLRQLENLEEDRSFSDVCGISPPTPITFREEWNIRIDKNKLLQYGSAIDIVVVRDFNIRCFTQKNCHSMMEYFRDRGKLEDINFFIAEDGQVYEYLGWEYTEKEWFKNRRAIIVAFLGTYSNYEPSKRAFATFDKFLQYGQKWGYLSKNYIISSYRQIKNDASYLGNALNNELTKMDRFTDRI